MNSQQQMNQIDSDMERKNEIASLHESIFEDLKKQLSKTGEAEYMSATGKFCKLTLKDIVEGYVDGEIDELMVAKTQAHMQGNEILYRGFENMIAEVITKHIDLACEAAANEERGITQGQG